VDKDIEGIAITLHESSLALDEVVVTAQKAKDGLGTTHSLGRDALNHLQLSNMTDVAALLPGGKTINPDLTSDNRFSLRDGGSATGNPAFGTAVEVDGVRLSNNANFTSVNNSASGVKGVSTNNIASSNVESVEVITGVPSVEYGDMTSGVVKINTRKGATDYIVTASTNPRTKQVSASKGFHLGESARGRAYGVINANIEYTKAVSDRMSPYTAYDRKQLSLIYSNTFNKGAFADTPLQFTAGVTGNLGGMDSQADPDKFLDTLKKAATMHSGATSA
jgi:outer membrane receptor protein involved in Fe transport